MQRFRSCLALSIKILLPFYLLLFGCMTYAPLRMWWINVQLFQVAEQLGYTPAALLQHEVYSHDGFLLGTMCEADLYFTTTLSVSEFRQRLVQVLPDTLSHAYPPPMSKSVDQLFLPDDVHINAREVTSYVWLSGGYNPDIFLTFIELADANASVDYKGLPVTGNIVELRKRGFSAFMWNCPVTVTERTPPSN
jgi:hypothetical protein